jgi:hypothetical protein
MVKKAKTLAEAMAELQALVADDPIAAKAFESATKAVKKATGDPEKVARLQLESDIASQLNETREAAVAAYTEILGLEGFTAPADGEKFRVVIDIDHAGVGVISKTKLVSPREPGSGSGSRAAYTDAEREFVSPVIREALASNGKVGPAVEAAIKAAVADTDHENHAAGLACADRNFGTLVYKFRKEVEVALKAEASAE